MATRDRLRREVGLQEGIVSIEGRNAVFMDPVRVLSAMYPTHDVKPDSYYTRALFTSSVSTPTPDVNEEESGGCKKRKRTRKLYTPNEKEAVAESRHKEVRLAILEAHEAFEATVSPLLQEYIALDNNIDGDLPASKTVSAVSNAVDEEVEVNFVELAALWQAPLYELTFPEVVKVGDVNGQVGSETEEGERTTPLFNTVIENSSKASAVVQCGGCRYLLPKLSRFLISDFTEVHQLISEGRYNLMVIDPPWENKSVHRRALYPTLPNRYLLSLPVQQLSHADGALVALWITNREKLRHFAETELFPAWGVTMAAVWYWLKVTAAGKMVSPLDLVHHKPYECLLLGYVCSKAVPNIVQERTHCAKSTEQPTPPDKFVIISVPGDHSRKPPLQSILSRYIPGRRPEKGLELFARELTAGWTSWGNEPLRFQHVKCFLEKENQFSE